MRPLSSLSGFPFRLIDVRRRCIVQLAVESGYLALSYVWGGVEQLELRTDKLQALMADGALADDVPKIPQTVKDAMILCETLGEAYLWVDTLCIQQDDLKDKIYQIKRMGSIYSGAVLVICAASGVDANSGLPGVRTNSRLIIQHVETIQEYSMGTILPDLEEALASCPWESRGWTFQEKELALRLLIFGDHQVYFHCREARWWEDKSMELTVHSPKHIRSPLGLNANDLTRFCDLVEAYTRRNLTYESDTLNAFSGILRSFGTTFGGWNNTFNNGLPVVAFDFTFTWYIDKHSPDARRAGFPSWSWAGWAQQVHFNISAARSEAYPSALVKVETTPNGAIVDSQPGKDHVSRTWADFTHSDYLYFQTSSAHLAVDRIGSLSARPSEPSQWYEVRSRFDESICFGQINLDRHWRSEQPDDLEFIVVRATRTEGILTIKALMCIETLGSMSYRVQILLGDDDENHWRAARPVLKKQIRLFLSSLHQDLYGGTNENKGSYQFVVGCG